MSYDKDIEEFVLVYNTDKPEFDFPKDWNTDDIYDTVQQLIRENRLSGELTIHYGGASFTRSE